jgi:hypothetical protein
MCGAISKNERLTWRLKSTPRSCGARSDSLTVSKGQSHECPARYIDYWSCGVCYCSPSTPLMQCIYSQKWSYGPAHRARGPIPRMHGMALLRSQRVIMSGLLNWILHMERLTAIITQEAIFSPSSCVSECGAVIALSQLSHCQLCVCMLLGKRDSTPTWLWHPF